MYVGMYYVFIYICISRYVFLSMYLSVCLPIYLSVCLSIYLYVESEQIDLHLLSLPSANTHAGTQC